MQLHTSLPRDSQEFAAWFARVLGVLKSSLRKPYNLEVLSPSQFPRCAWLLDLRRERQALFRGPWVEVGEGWFYEGAWAGDFSEHGFLGSHFRCGSGGVIWGKSVVIAPPSHSLEAVYCFRFKATDRWLASNSFACILGADPATCCTAADLGTVRARAQTIKKGCRHYKQILYRNPAGTMYRVAFDPFVLRPSAKAPEPLATPLAGDRPFTTYQAYVDFLIATLDDLSRNAASVTRNQRFDRLIASCSSGYDSPACAVLARHVGCDEVVSLSTGRGGDNDSGSHIAELLGMRSQVYPRFASGAERKGDTHYRLDVDDYPLETVPHIDAFHGSIISEADAVYAPFAPHLEGRLYVTGQYAGTIWRTWGTVTPAFSRGESSGAGLHEFRKRVGFVDVPLAFAGARHPLAVRAISLSEEMAPFRIGGSYDRPIPRRILEEAGVPRTAFARQKLAAGVLFASTNAQRFHSLLSVAKSYSDALKSERSPL